jgi:hypothetical protein
MYDTSRCTVLYIRKVSHRTGTQGKRKAGLPWRGEDTGKPGSTTRL